MLYLTRKIGQSIMINDKIEVKIVEIKGKNVKVGIEFPKSTTVLRKEVYDNVVAENIEASQAALNEDSLGFFEKIIKDIASQNASEKEEK